MGGFRNLCLPKGDSFFDAYKKTFSNQRNFATRIYKSLQKNAVSILAKAPTQSGKTGSMIALTYEFLKHDAHSPSHVFVFTPHSSKEWLDQTCARFPAFFRDQIYHRNQLDSLVSRLLPLQDVLIIVDECHIASKQHQAMPSTSKHCCALVVLHCPELRRVGSEERMPQIGVAPNSF